jgi:2-C-methyl-D-erythritol 4-phosphate cytidylyltransferase
MGKLGAVVAAAGKGTRMRSAERKQYLQLDGKPILAHTLQRFEATQEIDELVVVVGAADQSRVQEYIAQYGITKVRAVVTGGRERQHSVYEGLQALSDPIDWVLVHDGVRPFITRELILRCWHKARETEGAAVLAVPVNDTIKIVNDGGKIISTPDRSSLWAIQTPQAFRLSALKRAHEEAMRDGFIGTDDAVLMERSGFPVFVAEGDYGNIKITTPEDLAWAEFRLNRERRGEEHS